MYRFICIVTVGLVLQLLVSGCNADGGDEQNEIATPKIEHISKTDSVAYGHGTGKTCRVEAIINADYPVYYGNDSLTRKLQRVYIKDVLGVFQDSISVDDAFTEASDMLLRQFGESEDEIMYGVVPNVQILNYKATIDVSVFRNSGGVLTFCKHEVVNKDREATVDMHHYINFDLSAMRKIEIFDLFEEAALQDVSQLLKEKLLKQLNVDDEDALTGLGYFNLDNITANDNFYFDENGVTWNYVTYEIACYSVGETQITLDYDALAGYITPKSVLYNR